MQINLQSVTVVLPASFSQYPMGLDCSWYRFSDKVIEVLWPVLTLRGMHRVVFLKYRILGSFEPIFWVKNVILRRFWVKKCDFWSFSV